ncbi:MAG TPA: GvpL/GvpF family gas vesicle protein [Solirubrobacteraceae bacterium]|nr:GvpL/GvpF family gas vesicle protein [Solirubrobacteraceae bacterium]
MTEYVYGIVEASAPGPSGTGIGGAPLRLIEGDGAAALVSAVRESEVQLGREELLAHARILSDALERGTVLPMRFGVVMERPDEVRDRLLAEHSAQLREQLQALAGKVEIELRATYDESTLMREVVRDHPDIARLAERGDAAPYGERIELGQRVAEAIARAQERDTRDIVEVLSQVAVDVAVRPPGHERVACSASFLVERERLSEFDRVLDAFADGQGGRLRFKYNGPLPPHSFVELAGAA